MGLWLAKVQPRAVVSRAIGLTVRELSLHSAALIPLGISELVN
jgi:hypothetical protein